MKSPVPWTREQVEAWVNCEDLPPRTGRVREVTISARRAVVRLCPEAPDYNVLRELLETSSAMHASEAERLQATETDVMERVTRAVAALWAPILAPREEA